MFISRSDDFRISHRPARLDHSGYSGCGSGIDSIPERKERVRGHYRTVDFKTFLKDNGTSYTDKTGVHAMTFKAFVREQVESGRNLPFDLLGIYIGQKATIKKG